MPKSKIQNIFKNSMIVLSGNVGANIFGLLSMSIFSHSMGVKVFGYYVLFLTFIDIVDKVFNFQTWQAFIKYAIDFQTRKEEHNLIMLLKYCFLIDFISLFVAFFVALFSTKLFVAFFDVPAEYAQIILIMAFSLLFNMFDVSTGIFRVFDEFKTQSKIIVIVSFIKFLAFGLAAIVNPSFECFIVAMIFSQFIALALKLFYSKKILNSNGYQIINIINHTVDYKMISELKILSFVVYNNFNVAVRMISRQLDIVILGKLYGSEVVGIYRIAKEVSGIISKLTDPIYQAIYPELAKLLASGKKIEAKEVAIKISKYAGLAGASIYMFFIIFGEFTIYLTFGAEFLAAYQVVLIYFFAIFISIVTLPLAPMLYSCGLAKEALHNQIIATIIYMIVIYPLILHFSAIGAAFAYILFYVVWTFTTINTINKRIFL